MIFPQLGPTYYDEKDKNILKLMENFYNESITVNIAYWSEADTDTRFEAGDQDLWNNIYGNLPATRRSQFNFNRIRRVINMISGYQRRNRKSTIVVPVENSDQLTADQFTKIFAWLNQQEGILETISEAFHGTLVTGLNLLQVWVDYRTDPISGNIRVDNCPYNSFLIDPYFRKQDLSDCNAIWKRTFLTKQEVVSLLPDKKEEIESLPIVQGSRDGKFQFMPESYDYGQQHLMTYDEFYYRDYREQTMLIDTQTGEALEWLHEHDDALKLFLNRYPQVTMIKQDIPTVRLAIVVQGKVLYDGPNPCGIDTYPFVPVLAYYTPQMPYFPWRIQGVVRGLRDAQYLYNRRQIIQLDIFESQINSGWKYKENALVNPKDVFLSGQGRGLALKEEAQMTDVEQIVPPGIPPSMMQMSDILAKEIQEISGVSEELLGSATDDKAGILSLLRQGAGLTTLQSLFDQLDYSQRLLGKIILKIVQNNFTPGKVARILEEDPTPAFYNKSFGRYDAVVEEGINTSSQKQMAFAQAIHLKELGIPIPDSFFIENMTIQNKEEIIKTMEQEQQSAQQMQEQQAQLQMAQLQAQANLANARAEADHGLAIERTSRVAENEAMAIEREAAAVKDRMAGIVDIIKSLKELETIDITQLHKLVQLAQMLKSEELGAKAETKAEEAQLRSQLSQPTQQPQNQLDLQQALQETMPEQGGPVT